MTRKMAKAMIRKSITVLMKRPTFQVAAPAALASSREAYSPPLRVTKILEKSTPPSSRPIGGIRMSATKELTILPKRSEEHTSELQSLMRISYAVFCLKKKKTNNILQKIIKREQK